MERVIVSLFLLSSLTVAIPVADTQHQETTTASNDWVAISDEGALIESDSNDHPAHLSRADLLEGRQSGLELESGALLAPAAPLSRSFLPDYPGCSMGWFWCGKFKEAGIPAADAAKITANPDIHQPGEWFYDGQPTCVATRGVFSSTCNEVSSVLVCAGSNILTTDYGEAEDQVRAIMEAIENNSTFVHPSCPGCARGRETPHSVTTCLVPLGNHCDIECEAGFVPTAAAVRWCGDNGVVTGAECKPPLVPLSVTPAPPEPSPAPEDIVTPVSVDHSNWTDYDHQLDFLATAAYREILHGEACEFLLDLENYYHEIHLNPASALRRGLFVAGRAAECAWMHEMEIADAPQRVHHIPVRGDHGPWKESIPNVFRMRLPGYGVIAVSIEKGNELKGSDLYNAIAKALSVKPEAYTVYAPNSTVPIDDSTKLASLNVKSSDILEASVGRQTRHATKDQVEGVKLAWRLGAMTDPDRSPIAP